MGEGAKRVTTGLFTGEPLETVVQTGCLTVGSARGAKGGTWRNCPGVFSIAERGRKLPGISGGTTQEGRQGLKFSAGWRDTFMNKSDVSSIHGDETDRPAVPDAGGGGDGMRTRGRHGDGPAPPLLRGSVLQRTCFHIREKISGVPGLFSGSLAHALEQRRLLILMPFALVGGILLYRAARFEPSPVALGLIGVLLFSSLWIWRHSVGVFPFLVALCGVWAGAILLPMHGALFGSEMVYGAVYGTYRAEVERIHSDDGTDARIVISHLEPVGDSMSAPLRKARIVVPSSLHVRIGDRIEARLRLYKVPGPVVPGGFDSQFHAYFDGIGAFGTVLGNVQVVRNPARSGLGSMLQQLREGIGWRIDMGLGQPASGIARALIIGDQSRVEPQVRKDLAAAGLAHVLAISGLHLSLVAGGVFAAVRMLLALSFTLSRHVDPRKVAAVAGMAAALGYLALSGASVSASRATIMLVLVFGAVLAGRKALTMRNVAIAGLVLIIFSPAAIFRPGFELSFAAVIALVGVYEGYRAPVLSASGHAVRLVRWIGGIMLTSLIAGAATALFAAYHFQQVAPFGVFGNMVAIPLVALVVLPAGALGLLVMPLGMEGAFLSTMGWGIDRIIEVSRLVAAMGEGVVQAPLLGPIALVLGFAGLAAFAFFPTRLRYGAVAMVALLVPLFGTMPPPDILVADSTQAVAIRMGGVLRLVKGRVASFAVRAWQDNYLEPIAGDSQDGRACDVEGCLYSSGRYLVAIPAEASALLEDCHAADLVIARFVVSERCRAVTRVIDRNDLLTGGVHWARWNGSEFVIRPAISDPFRPWRPRYPQ